jgi:thymidine phosphorylase
MFKHGKRSIAARELRQAARDLAKQIDITTATMMAKANVPVLPAIKRRVHVKAALHALKEAKQNASQAKTSTEGDDTVGEGAGVPKGSEA